MPNGFVERGGPLVFLMFRAERAYLLDVGTHDWFESDELVRIAISNWPDDELFLEAKGILSLRGGNPYTDGERKTMRTAGISAFTQVNGRVFFPTGGGISTAGISVQACWLANRIIRALKNFEEHVQNNKEGIVAFIRKHGGTPANQLKFDFAFFQNGFGVIETTSGIPIALAA